MKKVLLIASVLLSINLYSQRNLDYYLGKAAENNPALIEMKNQFFINDLQKQLLFSQNSGIHISLSGNVTVTPYFNNSRGLITTNPDPNAIGYDIGLFNGGLYSAQLNFDKNIFNGAALNAYEKQQNILNESSKNNIALKKRELAKQITDMYLHAYLSFQLYRLSSETLNYMNDQLEILSGLVKNGTARQSDYLLLSIEKDNQALAGEEYLIQYKGNLIELNTLCGINDTSVIELEPASLQIKENSGYIELTRKFELDSLALINQMQLFETKYEPQVSLFFNMGLNAVELNNIQRKFGMSAGINFSLPIYDGSQRLITEQQNQISIQTIQSYKKNAVMEIFNQQRNSVISLENYRKALVNYSKQIERYKTVIDMAVSEMQRGQKSVIDFLSLLKNYTELKKSKINSDINYQLEINNYNYWN